MITHVTSSEQPDGRVLLRWEISNNAFQEDVQECLEAGMDAHIAKPIDVAKAECSFSAMLVIFSTTFCTVFSTFVIEIK